MGDITDTLNPEPRRIVQQYLLEHVLPKVVKWIEPNSRESLAEHLESWSIGRLEGIKEEDRDAFGKAVSEYHELLSGNGSGFDPQAGF